jgi:hypothetical protein
VVVIPTRAESRHEEKSVDRRGDEQPTKIPRECQMHNKEAAKTPSHVMRFVDLIFLHLLW